MAVVKALGGGKSKGSANNSLDYITDKEKADLIYIKDCSEDFRKDFQDTKEIWEKTEGRQYYHIVQSFEKEDYVTLEKAHEIGQKFIADNEKFKDYQVVMATHQDKDHIHNHFVINSVSMETGKKFEFNPKDLLKSKELSNEICKDYGFMEIDLKNKNNKNLQENTERYSLTEKALIEKNIIPWKEELRQKLDFCLSNSQNFDEFKENLKKENIEISRGTEKKGDKTPKSITFVFQEKKVRGSKLDTRYENLNSIEKSLEIEKSKINLQTLVNQNKNQDNQTNKLNELLDIYKKPEEKKVERTKTQQNTKSQGFSR